MLALFYIFIAVAIGVSFWQITRIMNFREVLATDKDNDIQGKLSLGFLAFVYAMMIYCLIAMNVIMLPESASIEGEHDDNLFDISFWLIGVVQFLMQFLIFYFTFKYRGNKDKKALFYADSHKLEFIWTVTPAVVLVGLIGYGLWQWNNIMYVEDEAVVIEVYSKQFQWEARYAGADKTLGLGNVNFIKGINTMGVDMSDKNSQDDKQVTEIHLPKGKKVLFKFRSQDVLHSAYMPHFRAQMNCVPGMVTQFGFTPKYTTEEMRALPEVVAKTEGINKIRKANNEEEMYTFDYLLLCNKICGASHYNMQMKIVVESEEDYNKWLSEQKTLAQVIK
ncbi:cytochrome c oxidase subunit II [Tenacibaculum sp.]|nr:cytochrome c oxidase subunit II [Tenacibaculum sp.]